MRIVSAAGRARSAAWRARSRSASTRVARAERPSASSSRRTDAGPPPPARAFAPATASTRASTRGTGRAAGRSPVGIRVAPRAAQAALRARAVVASSWVHDRVNGDDPRASHRQVRHADAKRLVVGQDFEHQRLLPPVVVPGDVRVRFMQRDRNAVVAGAERHPADVELARKAPAGLQRKLGNSRDDAYWCRTRRCPAGHG